MELYYPELLTNKEAFPANIHFSFYKRNSTLQSTLQDQVHLYLPEQFGQPTTVTWDAVSMRDKGEAAIGTTMKALGVSGFLQTGLGKIFGGVADITSAASDFLTLGTGYTINPYLAQIFRGVDLRSFNLVFRFTPFQLSDCDKIHEIIKIFRKWSLPAGGQWGAGAAMLEYPGEVDVRYQFMDAENPYLHRFKRAIMTKVDIEYTGAGQWTMMRNGFPTEIVMNISFAEIQIVVREDVENFNY